jgi:hypothetical protein
MGSPAMGSPAMEFEMFFLFLLKEGPLSREIQIPVEEEHHVETDLLLVLCSGHGWVLYILCLNILTRSRSA